MRLRRAARDDVDALAALEAEALGADAWSPALLRAGVVGDLPTVHHLVAEAPDGVDRAAPPAEGIVGYAVVSLAGDVAELQRIAVTATARRTGVASALLAVALDAAATAGADRVVLEVREDNAAALALYAAHGFTAVARRRGYYADGAPAAVLQRAVRPRPDAAPQASCPE